MPIVCDVCDSTLTLVITTDAFGSETTYTLGDTEGSLCFDDVYGGSGFEAYTIYTIDISNALCDGMDYTFTLYDSWGDGICCGKIQRYDDWQLDEASLELNMDVCPKTILICSPIC